MKKKKKNETHDFVGVFRCVLYYSYKVLINVVKVSGYPS